MACKMYALSFKVPNATSSIKKRPRADILPVRCTGRASLIIFCIFFIDRRDSDRALGLSVAKEFPNGVLQTNEKYGRVFHASQVYCLS